MTNIFFVKERCPISLSLAGYLLNSQQICREIVDDRQFIIPATDEKSLCFGAVNVIDILKNTCATRVFVQGTSKNINAVSLATYLLRLDLFIIADKGSWKTLERDTLAGFGSLITSSQSVDNFEASVSSVSGSMPTKASEKVLVCTKYPPPPNWFINHSYFTLEDLNEYHHDNYFLPNYVSDFRQAESTEQIDAVQIRDFFVREESSSWVKFKTII